MSQWQAVLQLRVFRSILSRVVNEQHSRISCILELFHDELDAIWSWTSPLPPRIERCMHDIVAEQAHVHPEKNAVEAWDGSLTYNQVDQYSSELAQNLRLLNDAKNQIIPLLFEKSKWTVVAVLAVMKSGACFALLDPAQPEGRLSTIVKQTGATLLISAKSQASLAARIAPYALVIPISESKFLNIFQPFAEQQPRTSLPPVSSSGLMYIQFTSGSTGVPKGCMLSHDQYTSGALPRAATIGYHSDSRVLDFASYAFDVSVDSMLCTLACGGTLCTPSEERRMNDLSRAMRDMRVNLAGMTPSVVRTLDADILSSLKSLAVGGEGISASDAADWQKETMVVNCYGPSECTVGATYNNNIGTKPYISMGNGTGCAAWIVDPKDHDKLVPPGAVGELLIEGPIVGYGYLNNPEKTKEVFIEDPAFLLSGTSSQPGRHGRLYKTGDLVRYDPDGNGEVIFVGRQDQQVKLRGQRIELTEIEYNMIKNLPSETKVVAEVIKPGGTGEATLIAFIVEPKEESIKHLDGDVFTTFSPSFRKTLQIMTTQILQDLPIYMVPSAYIPLWKMPLLVSCKTDRKSLREIGNSITRQELRRFSAAISPKRKPKNETEVKLAKLWAHVLGGNSDFGGDDNFFRMGGDSLRAMRLVAAAREDGLSLSVPDIMLSPTLSAMASKTKALHENHWAEVSPFSLIPSDWNETSARVEAAKLCDTELENIEDIYPCTPLQEGLMALSAKFLDAYVAQRVVELPAHLIDRLMDAIGRIAQDAPILRTRIVNISSRGLFQVVLKNGQLQRDHGTHLAAYLKLDQAEPMELGKALFRYSATYNPENDKGQVTITAHHAVYDGWSMPLVLERVNCAFRGSAIPRPVSFKHFIKHFTHLDTSITQQYWSTRLQGASPHQFPPLPHKGYVTRADSLLEHYVNVAPDSHSKFTIATMIRGAWGLVSSLYLGRADIVFGETLTGRSAPVTGIERIEGPMITTVPIRVKIDFNKTAAQYLELIHNETVQQMPHEHFGLQNIRRLSRDAREACELRTGLVLHPKEDEISEEAKSMEYAPANSFLPSDDAEAAREALKFNTYALMLVCTLDENGFLIMASFDSKCISSPVMERVLKVLDRMVTVFLKSPESKLGFFATLEQEEQRDATNFMLDHETDTELAASSVNGEADQTTLEPTRALTSNESRLKSLLSHVLGIPEADISLNDTFFELGGDSIGAMRLVSEARLQGLKLTVIQVFSSRSLSELAKVMKNETEEKLIGLLSHCLGIPKSHITSNDGFFELGGDSITAMRLVSEARSQGLNITVSQIFQSKSISELAALPKESTAKGTQDPVDAPFALLGEGADSLVKNHIQPMLEKKDWKIIDTYPARPLQKVAVDGTVQLPRYSLRYELMEFDGPVDEIKVAQSAQKLTQRNEVLRTVFVDVDGQCLGVVLDSFQIPFEKILVPNTTGWDSFISGFIKSDIEAPKPYGTSFVAFTLFQSESGKATLSFRISHAQYDEMCLPLLFSQFAAIYARNVLPDTQPFGSHVNHVVRQSIPASIPYWRNLLSGSQMSIFKPDILLTTRKSASMYREFDISSRSMDITIGSFPTAAWAIVLSRRLHARDVVFGEVVTGRNVDVEAADRIIGPTWQYVPFRVSFTDDLTYRDLLQQVQDQHVASSAHEGMSLPEIVKECTDWDPVTTDWYDSVVHQAPQYWVENMDFGESAGGERLQAKFETRYPHAEPLREWKIQAFVKDSGRRLGIEVVCFEEWREIGEEVLGEIGEVLGKLVGFSQEKIC